MTKKHPVKRKWFWPFMALISVALFSFCADEDSVKAMTPPEVESNSPVSDGEILVAYFSRANYVPEGTDGVTGATNKAGNTQTVAYYIKDKMGADIFEIVPERDYPVSHSECSAIAQEEWRTNARPALRTHVEDMEKYSVIFVGFPIWVYREPTAVLTFLEEYDFAGKTVIPFCTSMAVSVDQSVEDFRNTLPASDVRNGISVGYTLPNGWQNRIDEWIEGLNLNENDAEESFKITMTVNGNKLSATLYNNATTRAFIEKLPITLPMMDLYNREMCYRFPESLPTDDVNNCGYEVGEIVYYPPMHSFVILYEQNGAHFSMQKLGKMDSDVSFFDGIGDVDVTFELESSYSGISEVSRSNTSVQTLGNKIIVDTDGQISASLYALNGTLVGKSSGFGHVELDALDYRGMAILDMNIDGQRQNKKVILK